ncbi:hypothetical protein AB833_14445 [Chromatiales bacterium (ex Bugula neritina AB1)]|nr:hypothetical protein AB833_14445 [Chromatiales bacterium (ex Bugula neritina AB1)]
MRVFTSAMLFLAVSLCVTVQAAELKEDFSYGLNYAWKNYSGDFGGIAAWAKSGVASDPEPYEAELQDMAAHGIEVVRWWVWPEFWNDAITFAADGTPNPLAQSAIDDGLKALELADKAGLRIMFCLFSFDGFRPTRESYGITMTGYRDIVIDDNKRAALMSNIVRPFARALHNSPYSDSLHSWDVINEPEWAVTGDNKYGGTQGGDKFDPAGDLEAITHDQMEVFLADSIKVLRMETPEVPVSIGSAALKWATAWTRLDVDFYQTHIYDWVNDYWPYSLSPADFGMDDKPLIMGEYPVEGLRDVDHQTMLSSWYSNGYAGALGWDYRITHSPGLDEAVLAHKRNTYLQEFRDFAQQTIPDVSTPDSTDIGSEPVVSAAKSRPLSKPGRALIDQVK